MSESKPSNPTFNAATVSLETGGMVDKSKHSSGLETGKTFSLQSKLPRLPIPKLEDTCRRYLESLKPLQVSRIERVGEDRVEWR